MVLNYIVQITRDGRKFKATGFLPYTEPSESRRKLARLREYADSSLRKLYARYGLWGPMLSSRQLEVVVNALEERVHYHYVWVEDGRDYVINVWPAYTALPQMTYTVPSNAHN